jgi:starch phosphorylase
VAAPAATLVTGEAILDSPYDRLLTLARDLWWSWQPDGPAFWEGLEPDLWRRTGHNPVAMVRALGPEGAATRLRGRDAALGALERARAAYLDAADTWHARAGAPLKGPVAYFSAEFGVHESLPTYSGGLGILAGDHTKSASDLGLPFVGIGLLYRNGYVHQHLDADGNQVAVDVAYDFESLPVTPCTDEAGQPLRVTVEMGDGAVRAQIWRALVGRTALYLLDADVPENVPHHRAITARLYGGDNDTRIRQELLLGVGGVRALVALGLRPVIFHLNEGHSSFLTLERTRQVLAAGEAGSFAEALRKVRGQHVFTTHTPVEAGHDRFDPDLAWTHLRPLAEALGLSRPALLRLGHWPDEADPNAPFNMTHLALHAADRYNGVAALHGVVSRKMFSRYWRDTPQDETPITHVTNGVHAPSWQSPALVELVSRSMPADWRDRPETDPVWERLLDIPDAALWQVHRERKLAMFQLAREREAERRHRLGLPPAPDRFDPDALTIGFARRFAPYKRANLLFYNVDRLRRILEEAPGPVQFLFAGKAHPADDPGRALVREVYRMSQEELLRGRLLLVEDYDIELGRALVQGVDVWLNNPRRPKEASGTSGMKAAMNGAPNLSVLDGWWPEGYDGRNGWAIGEPREYPNVEAQDAADADSLYRRLEEDVIPLYYAREASGLPRGWIAMMKEAIRTVTPRFHSDRQVRDYVHHLYAPG